MVQLSLSKSNHRRWWLAHMHIRSRGWWRQRAQLRRCSDEGYRPCKAYWRGRQLGAMRLLLLERRRCNKLLRRARHHQRRGQSGHNHPRWRKQRTSQMIAARMG